MKDTPSQTAERLPGRTSRNFSEGRLIQIVPQWSAEPNGVADYALALAHGLETANGMRSIFLSASPHRDLVPLKEDWRTVFLSRREGQTLASTLHSLSSEIRPQAVLLHYSGYGYQKRGVPSWLVHGLRTWRRRSNIPLITVFHELYATGKPWQSSFWLSSVQKGIAGRILRMSSKAITPTRRQRELLSRLQPATGIEIASMPVLSNVGELGCGPQPHARAATAAVFGLAGVEGRLYGIYRQHIERLVRALRIEKLIDIGQRLSATPTALGGVPVKAMGVTPPHVVGELLQDARLGFLAYPTDLLGKSGVFAAYAAHGVVPIVLSEKKGFFDGLAAGRHFVDGLSLRDDLGLETLTSIQRELYTWYVSHSLHVQADFLCACIKEYNHGKNSALA
jgi:hypothetical protein